VDHALQSGMLGFAVKPNQTSINGYNSSCLRAKDLTLRVFFTVFYIFLFPPTKS